MDPEFAKHVSIKNDLNSVPEHTFVMFYDNWCDHCHNASGIWKEIGKTFKDNKNVLICAIETGEDNRKDKKENHISGFPTFCYYKDGKYQHNYDKERSTEGFKKWINECCNPKQGGKSNRRGKKTHKKRIVKKMKKTLHKTRKWLNLQ